MDRLGNAPTVQHCPQARRPDPLQYGHCFRTRAFARPTSSAIKVPMTPTVPPATAAATSFTVGPMTTPLRASRNAVATAASSAIMRVGRGRVVARRVREVAGRCSLRSGKAVTKAQTPDWPSISEQKRELGRGYAQSARESPLSFKFGVNEKHTSSALCLKNYVPPSPMKASKPGGRITAKPTRQIDARTTLAA